MLDLKLIIGAVVTAAVFGFGLATGWHFGSRKVASLESQIKDFENAGREAQAQLKKTQDDLNAKMAQQANDYKTQADKLQQEAATRQSELQVALAGKDKRIADIEAKRKALNADLAAAQEQLKNATPDQRANVEKKIQDIAQAQVSLTGQETSESCLAARVPVDVLKKL
jgi:chromosome segregation ATPase